MAVLSKGVLLPIVGLLVLVIMAIPSMLSVGILISSTRLLLLQLLLPLLRCELRVGGVADGWRHPLQALIHSLVVCRRVSLVNITHSLHIMNLGIIQDLLGRVLLVHRSQVGGLGRSVLRRSFPIRRVGDVRVLLITHRVNSELLRVVLVCLSSAEPLLLILQNLLFGLEELFVLSVDGLDGHLHGLLDVGAGLFFGGLYGLLGVFLHGWVVPWLVVLSLLMVLKVVGPIDRL
mmetsp:Transcript_36984/g.56660  ORF Transcript_36984/g.56660 Transcript_36984/m.56660 type:complete len:233 (-) Transcript_36984:4045-4743(-)